MCNDTNAVTIPEENMKPESWYAPLSRIQCANSCADGLRERLILLGMLGLTKEKALSMVFPTMNRALMTAKELLESTD